ncbi:MAG TPA: C-terminal binding protein [Chloroflexota bacterium]|nr:C-terminal binding protein [Chloroflexota bacterium]
MAEPRRYQVVITDCDHGSIAQEEQTLTAAGARVRLEQCRTEREVAERCGDADALLVQYAPISRQALAGLPRCRVVVRYGVGYDTLDLPALTAAGLWACNVPDYSIDEVSTQAIALLLALNRQLPRLGTATAAGVWDFSLGRPAHRLLGQTLGLIGFGRIGRATGRKALGLGLRLLATDPAVADADVRQAGAEPATLEHLLAASDAISLHLPLTAATRHLLGPRELASMRPTAYLVNTARGGLIDEQALYAALVGGALAGAALDVLEQEPPAPDYPLLRLPNCLVTPHSGWYSEESFAELKTKAAEEAVRVLRGERPRYALNTPAGRPQPDRC